MCYYIYIYIYIYVPPAAHADVPGVVGAACQAAALDAGLDLEGLALVVHRRPARDAPNLLLFIGRMICVVCFTCFVY